MKKKVVSLILVLCMAVSLLPVSALADKDSGDVAYSVDDGNIWFDRDAGMITDCDESVTSANIPDTIEVVAVTSVGDGAFISCDKLKDIYYLGSENAWKQISIGEYNNGIVDAPIHCLLDNTAVFCGHTYKVFDVSLNWTDAKVACEKMGGHLVTITSREENDFVAGLLQSFKKFFYWTGGTDSFKEGCWEWITGEKFNYSYWLSGQPDNKSDLDKVGENYLALERGSRGWNDLQNTGDSSGNSALKNAGYVCEWDNESAGNDSLSSTIADETILRAKLLSADYSFAYHRTAKSVVQIMADQLDTIAPSTWYTVENFLDMYFDTLKKGSASPADVGDVSAVEFYEYLLFKLLDNKELNYMSLTKPFDLVDDLTGGAVSGDLLKELVKAGFEAGTKIEDKDKKAIKDVCVAYCGTDSLTDIGILDYFLTTGKSIDKFLSEFTTYYALTTVSDAREEAVRLIGQTAKIPALRTAAENVCASIESVKKQGVTYCLSEGAEAAASSLATWIMGKMFDAMCELHPASKVWKKTVDYTTAAMDMIFQTDDIATDTIYIVGMSNVEKTLLSAINQAEKAFLADNSVENAQRYIALADTLQRDLIVGCDLAVSLVDHTERGNLNWHGLLDIINLVIPLPIKGDFPSLVKWMFGDPDSDYSHARKSIQSIKRSIENTDFYTGTVSALDLLQNKDSVTPSPWAREEVNRAISCGILPEWVRTNYQSNITRLEFCALLEFMIEQKTGKTVLQLADELEAVNGGQIKPPFDDALYMEANDIARLGIINGVGDNKFNPLGEITRQEAAIMLYRTADVLGCDTTSAPADHTGVADWAVQGVDFVISKGIMSGTDHGFDPLGKYTKEQAIVTLVRFFENM